MGALALIDARIRELTDEVASRRRSDYTTSSAAAHSTDGGGSRGGVAADPVISVVSAELCHWASVGDLVSLQTMTSIGAMLNAVDAAALHAELQTPLLAAISSPTLTEARRLQVAEWLLIHGATTEVSDVTLKAEDLAVRLGRPAPLIELLRSRRSQSPAPSDAASDDRSLKDSFDEASIGHLSSASQLVSAQLWPVQQRGPQFPAAKAQRPRLFQVTQRSPWFAEFHGLVLVMVGLPARGKSFVSFKIARYFAWSCVPCQQLCVTARKTASDASASTASLTQQVTRAAEQIAAFLTAEKGIAILDGTQTTVDRRNATFNALVSKGIDASQIIFLEIIHTKPEVIDEYVQKSGHDPASYRTVIQEHERVYECMSAKNPDDYARSFIQRRDYFDFYLHRIQGSVPTRLVYMLQNMRPLPQTIYLSMPGETTNDVKGLLGGDTSLSPAGARFAARLEQFLSREPALLGNDKLVVLGGSHKRVLETVAPLRSVSAGIRLHTTLNDVSYGEWDETSAADAVLPDPYASVYPDGESVKQVYESRLEPHIHEINSAELPTLVVAPRALVQGLLLFFSDLPFSTPAAALTLRPGIQVHHVVRISPRMGHARGGVEMFDLSCDLPTGVLDRCPAASPLPEPQTTMGTPT